MISDPLALWDYRRRVDAMYRRVRDDGTCEASWLRWRAERDSLLSTHARSPIHEARRKTQALFRFFDSVAFDAPPENRLTVEVNAGERLRRSVSCSRSSLHT